MTVNNLTLKTFFDAKSFQPCHDLVLVKRIEEDAPLIHIPDAAKEREQKCVVVKVGPGRLTEFGITVMPPCKAGDTVFVQPHKCFNIEVGGEKLALYNSQDILGVFEGALEPSE